MYVGVFLAGSSFAANIFGSQPPSSPISENVPYWASILPYFRLCDLNPSGCWGNKFQDSSSRCISRVSHKIQNESLRRWAVCKPAALHAGPPVACSPMGLGRWASVSVWVPSRSHCALCLSNNREALGAGGKSCVMQHVRPGSVGLFLQHKNLELQPWWA